MRLATFNINNINKRLDNHLAWLAKAEPDVGAHGGAGSLSLECPKFNYKLAWLERLIAYAAELMASGAPVVLAGDYDVVPTPQDIYPTRSLDNNALIQPENRQAFARLLAQGWTDAMRRLHPDAPLWTFWDYKYRRWPKDKGMRLDHFLLSPRVADRLVDGSVDGWARGQVNASDHAPTWIMLDP